MYDKCGNKLIKTLAFLILTSPFNKKNIWRTVVEEIIVYLVRDNYLKINFLHDNQVFYTLQPSYSVTVCNNNKFSVDLNSKFELFENKNFNLSKS